MKGNFWTRRTHLFRPDEFICSNCKAICNKPCCVCPVCGVPMKKTKYDASWVDEAEALSAVIDDDW